MKKHIIFFPVLLVVTLFLVSCTKSTENINKKIYKLSLSEDVKMIKIPDRDYEILSTEVPEVLYNFSVLNNEADERDDNYPAAGMSWFEALKFCNKLSEVCGLKPVYSVKGTVNAENWGELDYYDSENVKQDSSANGFRLPTNEEWIYAAEAGQNYLYAGSDNIDEVAWYKGNSDGYSYPIALKKPNAFGLYDMSGNLREWCWDENKDNHDERMMRTGSFVDSVKNCRLVSYSSASPNSGYANLGFRICRTVAAKKQFKVKLPGIKSSKTTITSNDKTIKADLVGTWVCRDGRWKDTLVFEKDGTFKYNGDYSYGGAEQVSVGPDGEITTKRGFESSGTYKVIDGNILHREYTSVWSNVESGIYKGLSTNKELRVISKNEFLMGGQSTWTKQ